MSSLEVIPGLCLCFIYLQSFHIKQVNLYDWKTRYCNKISGLNYNGKVAILLKLFISATVVSTYSQDPSLDGEEEQR